MARVKGITQFYVPSTPPCPWQSGCSLVTSVHSALSDFVTMRYTIYFYNYHYHTFIYKQNEPSCLYSHPQSINALWPVLISGPTEGRRLSWPG